MKPTAQLSCSLARVVETLGGRWSRLHGERSSIKGAQGPWAGGPASRRHPARDRRPVEDGGSRGRYPVTSHVLTDQELQELGGGPLETDLPPVNDRQRPGEPDAGIEPLDRNRLERSRLDLMRQRWLGKDRNAGGDFDGAFDILDIVEFEHDGRLRLRAAAGSGRWPAGFPARCRTR